MTNTGNRGWAAVMVAAIAMMLAAAIAAPAQQPAAFATLHNFSGPDGANPSAALIQGQDGNFYGTTAEGGVYGYGTVFRITLTGKLTTLYDFCSQQGCSDGVYPNGPLVQTRGENLYGTTFEGGAYGHGTAFKISSSGTLTTIYSFCSQSDCLDGDGPSAGLILAHDGLLYGTTLNGGYNGVGTVFGVTTGGVLKNLHSFGTVDGASPFAGLVQGTDGNFYGATEQGGGEGYGTIYSITAAGVLTTLYSFCSEGNCSDGRYPNGALIQAADGNLYGTTSDGGANFYYGTVFRMSKEGKLTTLYSFCALTGYPDGETPDAALVQAQDGNFYGTTFSGGAGTYGTIFQIKPSGVLTTLHAFDAADGAYPFGALLQGTNGNFYGATHSGGGNGYGTIFGLSSGLGPFVETEPSVGKVGASIRILGTSLTGAKGVTFNGTASSFNVVSSSLISTTVPAGATTGPVQVATPSGTLTSNVNFQVEP